MFFDFFFSFRIQFRQNINNHQQHRQQNKMNVIEINNAEWRVPTRYTNLTPLGQGAYGLVWSLK
jgi:hypothetical protein